MAAAGYFDRHIQGSALARIMLMNGSAEFAVRLEIHKGSLFPTVRRLDDQSSYAGLGLLPVPSWFSFSIVLSVSVATVPRPSEHVSRMKRAISSSAFSLLISYFCPITSQTSASVLGCSRAAQ